MFSSLSSSLNATYVMLSKKCQILYNPDEINKIYELRYLYQVTNNALNNILG